MVKRDKDCPFCKIRKGELPTNLVYYDDKCYVILDMFPSQKGEMLVITNNHYTSSLNTTDAINAHIFKIAKKFSIKAMKKLNAKGVKLIVNVGKVAAQLVDHTHVHIIPHYYQITHWTTNPNPQITNKEAEKLLKLLSEVSNVHAFECRNLDT